MLSGIVVGETEVYLLLKAEVVHDDGNKGTVLIIHKKRRRIVELKLRGNIA